MTPLQKTELELLKCVIEICDKRNLSYYLVCGSALGAVKYGGFIPWDDDVDIALPRADYERFCREASALLPEHYFLQNSSTDSNAPFLFSKLRDSRTTFVEKSVSHIDMNHGVYIDIFPLDGHPTKKLATKRFDFKLLCFKLALGSVFKFNDSMKQTTKLFYLAERALGFHKRQKHWVDSMTALISRYSTDTSPLWCNYGNWQETLEYASRQQYGKGAFATFEGITVRIPELYGEYLTQKYGDWRADLPEDQKKGHHYYAVCDLSRPYTDYIEKTAKGRIRLREQPGGGDTITRLHEPV